MELSQETMKKTGNDGVTLPAKTSGAPERTIREMPRKNCPESLSELLIDSAIDESEANSPIKATPQEGNN